MCSIVDVVSISLGIISVVFSIISVIEIHRTHKEIKYKKLHNNRNMIKLLNCLLFNGVNINFEIIDKNGIFEINGKTKYDVLDTLYSFIYDSIIKLRELDKSKSSYSKFENCIEDNVMYIIRKEISQLKEELSDIDIKDDLYKSYNMVELVQSYIDDMLIILIRNKVRHKIEKCNFIKFVCTVEDEYIKRGYTGINIEMIDIEGMDSPFNIGFEQLVSRYHIIYSILKKLRIKKDNEYIKNLYQKYTINPYSKSSYIIEH